MDVAPANAEASADSLSAAEAATASPPWHVVAAGTVLLALAFWISVYFYFAVPDHWFGAPTQSFTGAHMAVARGVGDRDGSRFVLRAMDASDTAIVSLTTPAFSASDYRRVRWQLSGRLSPDLDLALLWRSNYVSQQVNHASLEITGDSASVVLTPGEKNWIGRIDGLALAMRGSLHEPLVIEAVSVEPMDLRTLISDRLREWFTFKPWSGLSINTAPGGLMEQELWLPIVVVLVGLTAIALCVALQRWRRWPAYPFLPWAIGTIVLTGWLLLDARWLAQRVLQTQLTASIFAGKSSEERHQADIDGDLYRFIEQVRVKLPPPPARVFVFSDETYFRLRAGYHLYPYNVLVERPHGVGGLIPTSYVHPGDYVVAFLRHGMQYDSARHSLRWGNAAPVHAELLIAQGAGTLFRITP